MPNGVGAIVFSILKMRKLRPEGVSGLLEPKSLTKGTNNLSGHCGGPGVKKKVSLTDYTNSGSLLYVRKHCPPGSPSGSGH